MKQIHNNDEGLFAQEEEDGSAPYRQFAHQTAARVKGTSAMAEYDVIWRSGFRVGRFAHCHSANHAVRLSSVPRTQSRSNVDP
jgi:hypothetical protein